jgi:putative ABC transport system permease protein
LAGSESAGENAFTWDPLKNPLIEIVGVVGDVRNSSLEKAPGLTVYIPHWQRDRADMILVIRTAMDPAAITQAVRAEIRTLDAELPAVAMRTMQEIVSAGVAERRFQLTLVLVFAGVALALASLGIFGVVSYTTAQRRGEMGIRLALGATASDLRSLVLRQGLAPVLLGLVAGIGGALALGRALAGLLYGVRPSDPLTIAGVAVVLFAVSAIACYIPAVRVSRADPMSALHYE